MPVRLRLASRGSARCAASKAIRPQVLVLNGDIVDIWQFSKSYWPPAHMRVVRHLATRAAKGTKIHYLTAAATTSCCARLRD